MIAKDETGAKSESNIGTFTTRKANTAELILGKWMSSPDSDNECVRKNSYIHFSESVFTMTYIISNGADCRPDPVSFPYEFVSENSIYIHLPNGDTEVFTVFSISEDEIEFALSGMGSGRAIRAKED